MKPDRVSGRATILRRALLFCTVLYLLAPVLLFLYGWVRPLVATPLMVLLIAGTGMHLARSGRQAPRDGADGFPSWFAITLGFIPLLFVLLVSGIGGFGPQTWDWAKHNALFKTLIENAWPVTYTTESGPVALVYNVAWYLPGAAIGKFLGWHAANLALFAWTVFGAALAYLWVVLLSRGRVLAVAVILTLFSGMDALASFWHHSHEWQKIVATFDLEFAWGSQWHYPNTVSLFAHVPQHSAAAWLLTALVLDALEVQDDRFPYVLVAALGGLWSPFVVIGVFPFALYAAWRSGVFTRTGIALQWSLPNIGGALLVGILCLYYYSRYVPYTLPADYYPPAANMQLGAFYLTPLEQPLSVFLRGYFEFVAVEFLLLFALLFHLLPRGRERDLVLVAGSWLLVLPVFHYGAFNDLVMRASIPALFVFQICLIVAARKFHFRSATTWLLALVFTVGALFPLNMLRLHSGYIAQRGFWHELVPVQAVPGFLDELRASSRVWNFTDQYLGSPRSFFFTRVAAQRRQG